MNTVTPAIIPALTPALAASKPNRNLLFWSLHAMGWSSYGIAQYLGALLYGKPVAYTKVIVIASVAGFLLTAPLRYYCRWLWQHGPAAMIGSAEFLLPDGSIVPASRWPPSTMY